MKTTLILVTLAWMLSGFASAQSLTPEERKVWESFQEAEKLRDIKEMEKIALRNKKEMGTIFEAFSWELTNNDSIEVWDKLKSVGRALDDAQGGNYHRVQLKLLEKMSVDDRAKRGESYNEYTGLRSTIQTAVQSKDKEAIKAAAPPLRDLAAKFQAYGDPITQSYCLVEVAKAMESIDEQLEAVKLYDAIDQALTGAGLEGFPFHGSVRTQKDSLIKAGYDPNAKPGDKPTGPAGNTATSWSKDPAGASWSEPVALRLIVDEKATDIVTPNPANCVNTFRWRSFQVNGTKPIPFSDDFQPMGLPLTIRKDGLKIFVDDGSGEQEIKAISKPNVVELTKKAKDWEGNEVKTEYAWFAACGGDEQVFGIDINFSPSVSGPFNVRYAPACYLKGTVLGEELKIFDDNSSGRFGDPKEVKDGLTTWAPQYSSNDAMMFGKQKVAGPWTEFLEVDGEFYRLKLNPDDYTVVTRKLSVDTGTVKLQANKVKPSVVIIEEISELKGAYFLLDPKKPTTVPVGRYKLSYGVIREGSGKNEDTCEIFPPESGSIEVKKGEEAVLEIGAPFNFDFQMKAAGSTLKIIGKSVVIRGVGGEMYTRFFDDPPIPDKVTVKGAGKPVKMQKAVFDDFKGDGAAAWFPLDLDIQVKPGREYEVTLEIKKNKLFGGKIGSEPKTIKF